MGRQPDPNNNHELSWFLPYTKQIRCTCTKILFGGMNTYASPGGEVHYHTDEPLLFINNDNERDLLSLLRSDDMFGMFSMLKMEC